jgi:hypothetical protein
MATEHRDSRDFVMRHAAQARAGILADVEQLGGSLRLEQLIRAMAEAEFLYLEHESVEAESERAKTEAMQAARDQARAEHRKKVVAGIISLTAPAPDVGQTENPEPMLVKRLRSLEVFIRLQGTAALDSPSVRGLITAAYRDVLYRGDRKRKGQESSSSTKEEALKNVMDALALKGRGDQTKTSFFRAAGGNWRLREVDAMARRLERLRFSLGGYLKRAPTAGDLRLAFLRIGAFCFLRRTDEERRQPFTDNDLAEARRMHGEEYLLQWVAGYAPAAEDVLFSYRGHRSPFPYREMALALILRAEGSGVDPADELTRLEKQRERYEAKLPEGARVVLKDGRKKEVRRRRSKNKQGN